jgi:hypothetical protein
MTRSAHRAKTTGQLETLADAILDGPNGRYGAERECPLCGFRTWSRDLYWTHYFDAHEDDA